MSEPHPTCCVCARVGGRHAPRGVRGSGNHGGGPGCGLPGVSAMTQFVGLDAKTKMLPPVTYQGGKSRLAAQIVAAIGLPTADHFYDLCCGSGAVAIEAVNAGQDPKRITMVDLSPWGLFWKAIGDGDFNLSTFERLCAMLPSDPREIKGFLETMYRKPVTSELIVYEFLLLQAGALGGKAIWIKDGRWRNGAFRDYWLPTDTSNRRSHVNPMMPMPATIMKRVTDLADKMRGITGICADLTVFAPNVTGGRAYIDPPYADTTAYGYEIDVIAIARVLGIPTWVSEGRALTDDAVCLSLGRAKGGITGNRKKAPNEEWLSVFR